MSAPNIEGMPLKAVASRTATMAILAMLVGAVCALVWANLAVLPSYVVQQDGHAVISDSDLAESFSANFWFSMLAILGGVAIGIACWIVLRRIGWTVALVTSVLSLLGGLTCWALGSLIGPGQFAQRMAAAKPGESVQTALTLTTPSSLAIWVFAAVTVPLFAAALGPELDADHEQGWRTEHARMAVDSVGRDVGERRAGGRSEVGRREAELQAPASTGDVHDVPARSGSVDHGR